MTLSFHKYWNRANRSSPRNHFFAKLSEVWIPNKMKLTIGNRPEFKELKSVRKRSRAFKNIRVSPVETSM